MVVDNFTGGLGGSGAQTTVNQASGSNEGPGLATIGLVAVVGYAVYRVVV